MSTRKIYISDFTLAKLAADRKNPLLFREKTAIASSVDTFGVDAIELAPVSNSKEDNIIYRTIASAVKNSALCLPVGFTKESVEEAWNCISEAIKPCLQVALPVSTVQMEYIYHYKSAKMLPKITELCAAAKEKCDLVEFVALDATRADKDFLIEAIKAAKEAGAYAATLCDDAGVLLPDEFASLVKEVKANVDIAVYVRVSDQLCMAVATAFSAISAGADGVKAVASGTGELTEDKIASVIAGKGESLGISTTLEMSNIYTDVKKLTKKIKQGEREAENEPEAKENIFLDAESTIEQVSAAAEILGYTLSEEDKGKVFRGLQRICRKKSSVGSKELEALIAANAMQAPSTFHLDNYSVTASNMTNAMASVSLIKGTSTHSLVGVATGDGPIAAAFKAIEQCLGYHYELDDFQIQAVTEGKEALGSALVRLRSNGKLYSGTGLSTDIVAASIRAYLNALNKIVYDED